MKQVFQMGASNPPRKGINKADAISGTTLSSFLTFALLTYSKGLDESHWAFPYLSDQIISFSAGAASLALMYVFSAIRYFVNFKLHEMDYTKKIKFIEGLITIATDKDTIADLEKQRNEIISGAAKSISQEKF